MIDETTDLSNTEQVVLISRYSSVEYYRMLYFEAIDLAIQGITERFDQPGYRIDNNLENLILNRD